MVNKRITVGDKLSPTEKLTTTVLASVDNMVDIDEYSKLDKKMEVIFLLEALQEVGGNIHQANSMYNLYWAKQMADALNEYIKLADKIKNRLKNLLL